MTLMASSRCLSGLISILMLIPVILPVSVQAQEPLRMHSIQVSDSPYAVWLDKVFTEVFRRMEVPLQILYLPSQRASAATESGEIDGQFTRIFEYQEFFQNQIRVNESVVRVSHIAIARRADDLHLSQGWRSFSGKQLRVDYIRGVVVAGENLQKRVMPDYLTSSTDISQAMLKLKHNRTDVFVHADIALHYVMNQPEYRDEIVYAGLMDTSNLYPYLNYRHIELVPKMELALRAVKDEGLLMKYCVEAFGEENMDFCLDIVPLK